MDNAKNGDEERGTVPVSLVQQRARMQRDVLFRLLSVPFPLCTPVHAFTPVCRLQAVRLAAFHQAKLGIFSYIECPQNLKHS